MENSIIDIRCENTKIIFTILNPQGNYYLVEKNNRSQSIKLRKYSYNEFGLNLTNIGGAKPLGCGEWRLIGNKGIMKTKSPINFVREFSYQEINKVCIYDHAIYKVSIDNQELVPLILVEVCLGIGRISIKHMIKNLIMSLVSNLFNRKVKKNKIVFLTSNYYIQSGNGSILLEYMRMNLNLDQYNIIQINQDKEFNQSTIKRKILVIKNLLEANYIFVEDYNNLIENLKFNKNTQIIQLWHAIGVYKKVGYSRFGKNKGPSLYKNAHRKYTAAIVSSRKLIHYYAEAYGIDEDKIKVTGIPRIDKFLDKKYCIKTTEKIYRDFPSIKNKKIILYAPTFREKIVDNQIRYYYDYSKIDFKALYEFCNDEYICIFKWHPFIENSIEIPNVFKDKFKDFTQMMYSINDLLYITDILITDYSSVIFECMLLKKSIILYAYDLDKYEEERGMYYSIRSLKGVCVCTDFRQLIRLLKNSNLNCYDTVIQDNFDIVDQNACKRIVREILGEK